MQLKLLKVKHQHKQEVVSQEVVSQEVDSFTSISCLVPAVPTVSVHDPQTEEATRITKQQRNKKVDIFFFVFVTVHLFYTWPYSVQYVWSMVHFNFSFCASFTKFWFHFYQQNNEIVAYSTLTRVSLALTSHVWFLYKFEFMYIFHFVSCTI